MLGLDGKTDHFLVETSVIAVGFIALTASASLSDFYGVIGHGLYACTEECWRILPTENGCNSTPENSIPGDSVTGEFSGDAQVEATGVF